MNEENSNQEELEQPTEQLEQSQAEPQAQEDTKEQKNDMPDWFKNRLAQITAARRQAEERAANLERELEMARQGQSSDNQNVEELARRYAQDIAKQQVEQQRFIEKIGEIEKKAKSEFGQEYDFSVNNLAMAGVQSNDFLLALTRIPNAEKVITYLGKSENLDEAVRVASLSPVEMGIELSEISRKATKALSKEKSRAPAPIEGVGGRSDSSSTAEPPRSDTAAWIKWRQENARNRR